MSSADVQIELADAERIDEVRELGWRCTITNGR